MPKTREGSRRRFLKGSAALGGLVGLGGWPRLRAEDAPALIGSDAGRPVVSHGLQIGDVLAIGRWSGAGRTGPARLIVEWSRHESFARRRRMRGPHALEVSDFTARVDLTGLPDGERRLRARRSSRASTPTGC